MEKKRYLRLTTPDDEGYVLGLANTAENFADAMESAKQWILADFECDQDLDPADYTISYVYLTQEEFDNLPQS